MSGKANGRVTPGDERRMRSAWHPVAGATLRPSRTRRWRAPTSMDYHSPNSAFWVFRLLQLGGATATEIQHPGHVRYFSKPGLRRHVAEAGLDIDLFGARHIYIVLGARLGRCLASLAPTSWLEREYRLRSGRYFWHVSRFAVRASSFWADTFLVRARKPERRDPAPRA
jgi:hypothetical protein